MEWILKYVFGFVDPSVYQLKFNVPQIQISTFWVYSTVYVRI